MVLTVEQSVERMSGRGNRSTQVKPAPVSICPLQTPQDFTRDRRRDAAVGSRRLTASYGKVQSVSATVAPSLRSFRYCTWAVATVPVYTLFSNVATANGTIPRTGVEPTRPQMTFPESLLVTTMVSVRSKDF
jgi:hypothetical protein